MKSETTVMRGGPSISVSKLTPHEVDSAGSWMDIMFSLEAKEELGQQCSLAEKVFELVDDVTQTIHRIFGIFVKGCLKCYERRSLCVWTVRIERSFC